MYHPKTTKALPRPSKATPFARRQPPSLAPLPPATFRYRLFPLPPFPSPLPPGLLVVSFESLLDQEIWAKKESALRRPSPGS
ncbi:Translocase of chloroplast [Musa troglodytarum]|uniref:Translocase of chloroplast n=1 Tax=Musa troglodytarum TaxID=320322 RepID=A0A9E7EHT7_9LILI|nr:Translocase of chloroplast [Musa troglodytarum]URD77369.1 Translocase of chloroplast [Musa troglodytarum]